MSRIEDEFYENNIVYQQLRALFDLGREVYELSNDCAETLPHWKDDGTLRAEIRDIVAKLHFRSFKTLISVLILCNKGHGQDAMSLARTVFDNYLTLKYIVDNPEERIYRFKNYLLLEQKFFLERAKRPDGKVRPDIKKVFLEYEEKILKNYEVVKLLYVKNGEDENSSIRKFRSGKWAGVDRRQMAQELCLAYDYDYVFHYHSCYIHPHMYGLRSSRQETETQLRYGAQPSEEDVFPALTVAIRYFLRNLHEVAKTFELQIEQEIDSFLNRLTQLEDDYMKNQGFSQ
jgi:hypothetical protein